MPKPFEYALLRVVPRPERGELVNAGVVLYCPTSRFLDECVHLDLERLRALGRRPHRPLAAGRALRLAGRAP